MVVFGTSSWVTNEGLARGVGVVRMDLVNNCLSWLREKGALGEGVSVDPKERKLYDLGVPPPNRTPLPAPARRPDAPRRHGPGAGRVGGAAAVTLERH